MVFGKRFIYFEFGRKDVWVCKFSMGVKIMGVNYCILERGEEEEGGWYVVL